MSISGIEKIRISFISGETFEIPISDLSTIEDVKQKIFEKSSDFFYGTENHFQPIYDFRKHTKFETVLYEEGDYDKDEEDEDEEIVENSEYTIRNNQFNEVFWEVMNDEFNFNDKFYVCRQQLIRSDTELSDETLLESFILTEEELENKTIEFQLIIGSYPQIEFPFDFDIIYQSYSRGLIHFSDMDFENYYDWIKKDMKFIRCGDKMYFFFTVNRSAIMEKIYYIYFDINMKNWEHFQIKDVWESSSNKKNEIKPFESIDFENLENRHVFSLTSLSLNKETSTIYIYFCYFKYIYSTFIFEFDTINNIINVVDIHEIECSVDEMTSFVKIILDKNEFICYFFEIIDQDTILLTNDKFNILDKTYETNKICI